MALFEAHNLEKTYFGEGDAADTKALRDITFTIDRGEFVSIMGPSGSGKSTLLHILGFLDEHTGGEYLFDGKRHRTYSEDERAHLRNAEMGFVFQSFNLLPRQTVLENVILPLMYSTIPEAHWADRAKEVIHTVGLSHRTDFKTYKLSGGEKQRTAMARALVNSPRVVFADEPTGNLDSQSGKAVMEALQQLHDDLGHTIILITHETYTAEHADRIIHLKDGKVEKDSVVKGRRQAKESFTK